MPARLFNLVSFCQGCGNHYDFATALRLSALQSVYIAICGALPLFLTWGLMRKLPTSLSRSLVFRATIFFTLLLLQGLAYNMLEATPPRL